MTDREREFYTQHIRERLGDYRFKHSVNVSREAIRLARRYGGDEEKAELAGLLHDVMKDAGKKEQLAIIEKYGVKLNEVELQAPKLWHAIAGAVYVKKVLRIRDKDIVNAVRYHTTARARMTLLEKIVYIADYTSEERDYKGVEKMRKASNVSLEYAMEEALAFGIEARAEEHTAIHPDTFAAYNEIMLEKKENKK
ncbi:MAG: bis(5'-nucleosyl)-tetraphosphatase (symmetrical) YqeK [Clostridia bacterium]|nr:bis(5'-nucleosyl)-tetraphosphatase (symmetrical) YqeK [Clostridia bacterium]